MVALGRGVIWLDNPQPARECFTCEQHNMITSAEAERNPFSHLTLGGNANLINTDYDGTEISKD